MITLYYKIETIIANTFKNVHLKTADMESLTLAALKIICLQREIKIPAGSRKADVLALLEESEKSQNPPPTPVPVQASTETVVKRLNYIGSKYQLLDWLDEVICSKTGFDDLNGKRVGDLFAGTGIVSFHFRKQGACVVSNDAELYSHVITRAFNTGVYNRKVRRAIASLNAEIDNDENWDTPTMGYITQHYSPNDECERKFFTPENAKKIDYVRHRIEQMKSSLSDDEHNFLVASLLVSADNVGNVAAVYGCYLKNFKKVALRPLVIAPVHTYDTSPSGANRTENIDVLSDKLKEIEHLDVAYIDPPYNERQYSKNYFPLNQIAKSPSALESEPPLTGKTGIPTDCFVSPFCSKRTALASFEKLISAVNADWVFISYNTEGIVPREQFEDMLSTYGDVSVVTRPYKRFKSYNYNEDKEISELLFCIHKT